MEHGEGTRPIEPPKPKTEIPKPPEKDRSIEAELEKTYGKFSEAWKLLQARKPGVFSPATKEAYERERASLPWPLNQKDAALYMRLPGKGKNYGFELTWKDEEGIETAINLGHTVVQIKKEDEEGRDAEREPQMYYEEIHGDHVFNYASGFVVDYEIGTPYQDIPLKTASAGQWVISNEALRLGAILDNLKKYADSLPRSAV